MPTQATRYLFLIALKLLGLHQIYQVRNEPFSPKKIFWGRNIHHSPKLKLYGGENPKNLRKKNWVVDSASGLCQVLFY